MWKRGSAFAILVSFLAAQLTLFAPRSAYAQAVSAELTPKVSQEIFDLGVNETLPDGSTPKFGGVRIINRKTGEVLALHPTRFQYVAETGKYELYALQFGVEETKNDAKSVRLIGREYRHEEIVKASARIQARIDSEYELQKWDVEIDALSYMVGGWALLKSKTKAGLITRLVLGGIVVLGFTLWVDLIRVGAEWVVVQSRNGVVSLVKKPVTKKQKAALGGAFDPDADGVELYVSKRVFRKLVDRLSQK